MVVARALSSACRKIPPPTIFIYTLACTRISPVTFRAVSRLPPNSSSIVLRISPTARFSVMAFPVTLAASWGFLEPRYWETTIAAPLPITLRTSIAIAII
ncbi:hypothetical protein D3C80_1242440 [compost metagenome]